MEIQSLTLPSPVGGENLADAIDAMAPQDCIKAENVYCDDQAVKVRNGLSLFGTSGITGQGLNLISMMSKGGVEKLLHLEANALIDMTSGSPVSVTLPGNISASANWNIFNNRLYLWDGVNTPIIYNPDAGTAAHVTYHSVTPGLTALIAAGVFKNVHCVIQQNSASFWYSAAAAITGALTEYDLSPFFKKGGYLMFVGSWTNQLAQTAAELFVAVSSEGEILCYNGDAPNASLSSFSLVSRYETGRPLGYKAFVQLENDLWIITDSGLISLQALFNQGTELAAISSLPRKINPFIRQYAQLTGRSSRWQGRFWQKGQRVYINVPISSESTVLCVCNIATGAWSRYTFSEGTKCSSIAIYAGKPYAVNTQGRICQMETATNDDGQPIIWDLRWAWSFLGMRGMFKRWVDARAILFCFPNTTVSMGVASDFQDGAEYTTYTTGGTASSAAPAWDATTWDSSPWGAEEQYFLEWKAVSGQGHAASFCMKGQANNPIVINSVDLRVETGSQR